MGEWVSVNEHAIQLIVFVKKLRIFEFCGGKRIFLKSLKLWEDSVTEISIFDNRSVLLGSNKSDSLEEVCD